MIQLDLNFNSAHARIDGKYPLAELSFVIETVTAHFLGRKVASFSCERIKALNGDCILDFEALMPSGPSVISRVMTIAAATKDGFYPLNIENSFLTEKDDLKSVKDGQHGHGIAQQSGTTNSVVELTPNPNSPLDVIGFGIGDMFTGLFALGVKFVKWQGSLNKCQIYIKHNLSTEVLSKYLISKVDYDLDQLVSTLK